MKWLLFLCLPVIQVNSAFASVLFRVEAEAGGAMGQWKLQEVKGASEGTTLSGPAGDWMEESTGIPVGIPKAGGYSVWVRYFKQDTNCCGFYTLFRDEDGDEVAFHYCDFVPVLPTSKPRPVPSPPSGQRPGFVWERFDAVFERSLTTKISFGGYIHRGGYAPRLVDCVLVTDNRRFDPADLDATALERITASPRSNIIPAAVPGFSSSRGFSPTPERFAGVRNPDEQFRLGLIHNASTFANHAQALQLGFNRDHGYKPNGYGIKTLYPAEAYGEASAEFAKRYPSPEGRFVNADGQVGSLWSLSFPPLQEELPKLLEERIRLNAQRPEVEFWRISGEAGGYLDYSPPSQSAFRQWLLKKHRTIETLNSHWGSAYKAFDEIVPPKKFEDNRACWMEFRDFCGTVFAESVGRQLPIIRQLDPMQRPCVGQNSNLDLLAPYFTSLRPMDWEQYITVALAGERYVGWDTYCADDYMGCEVDLLRSISGGRGLLDEETNIHAVDPRIAARTYWTQVGKGVKGIYSFQFHEGTYHDSYPKWSFVRGDLTPKEKFAAISDAAHEVHRLEPLLIKAKVTYATKPVALFYSRLDLSLGQPHLSLWADSADSPYHVYETLRGLGYLVRWITPRQIVSGELDQVGAVVMVDCQYVPGDAAAKLEAWVKEGGVVIGDRWPGAWNEYAQPQDALARVFGVTSASTKPQGGALAMQQSSQGYGEVTIAAIDPMSLAESVGEMWYQWDATHPVARKVGDFMLSGYGLQRVKCTAGEVVGMTFDGLPGVVLNEYGRGKSLYFAMMMGSIYESGAAKLEWDSMHSGQSFGRLLDAFLKYSGVRPASVARLQNNRIASKLRVEAPLVTPEGNMVVCLTSVNDAPVGPFPLEVELPTDARDFHKVFVSTGGSRRLQPVAFKVVGSRLQLRMPSFDTHAAIIALRQSDPIVGLNITGAPRGAAGLLTVVPGQELTVRATVYNPKPQAQPSRPLELWLPLGWLQSSRSLSVSAIPAWGSKSVVFRVRPPAIAAALRLKPILARYSGSSTPATEVVWWSHQAPGFVSNTTSRSRSMK